MTQNKQILFLSRRDDRTDYDTAQSMTASLQAVSKSVDYAACFLEEVGIAYDGEKIRMFNTRNGRDIASYDGIFLLGWFKKRKHEEIALAVSLYAAKNGVKTRNTEALHNRSRGKISQYVLSALNGVATMPFAIATDNELLAALVAKAKIAYPMIVKSVTGSRGRHNYLVRDDDEFRAALADAPTKAFVAQPFIPNDGDYRLLVMGDRVRLAIHRSAASDTHLNNTSQGGKAVIVDLELLDQQMLQEAVEISKLLRREVTGVDMVVHNETGRHYFLEANNMPQLSTGSFVPEKAEALDHYFRGWVEK